MFKQDYSLEIISHHSNFKNKNLKKYYVEGIDTVGAWGDEPFEILFKNNTSNKVQVKLTIDGTDVLTGKLATTDITPDMWMVNGYGTLSLKAWPETSNGGAQLVFTSGSNSVALHTHGDLSNRGIIAAAVYVEGYMAPRSRFDWQDYISGPIGRSSYKGVASPNTGVLGDVVYTNTNISESCDSFSDCDFENKSLEKLVSVGAGSHVDQKINYVPGLITPVFTQSVRVKYMWWDELQNKLQTNYVSEPHPSGFPADKRANINLGSTPRIDTHQKVTPQQRPEYSRF